MINDIWDIIRYIIQYMVLRCSEGWVWGVLPPNKSASLSWKAAPHNRLVRRLGLVFIISTLFLLFVPYQKYVHLSTQIRLKDRIWFAIHCTTLHAVRLFVYARIACACLSMNCVSLPPCAGCLGLPLLLDILQYNLTNCTYAPKFALMIPNFFHILISYKTRILSLKGRPQNTT